MEAITKITNNLRTTAPAENQAKQPAKEILPQSLQNMHGSFKTALDTALHRQESLNFSKHAHMRLSARQLQLTNEQLGRVEEGLNRANAKGIRDSLVLVDDVALVVNVRSKTVITAMNHEQDNVFSNIDGAVVV